MVISMTEENFSSESQSRWSGRRVVLFYWLLLTFFGSAVVVGLGLGQMTAPSIRNSILSVAQDPHDGRGAAYGACPRVERRGLCPYEHLSVKRFRQAVGAWKIIRTPRGPGTLPHCPGVRIL